MRIYFIGQKGIPAVGGGVEHYVENLAVRLAAQGHDVFAYTRWNYSARQRRTYRGVHLVNLPSIPTKNFDAISHTLLASLHVLFMRADIIHYHSIGPASLLWLPKLVKRSTAVVATFQSQCYLHQKWGRLAQWYLKAGEYLLCRLADLVIVPSRILQKRCKRLYHREALRIPNGVSKAEKPQAGLLTRWGLKKGEYILAVSRLVRHKGLHHLIEAYRHLRTDKKLVIVGESSFTEDYVSELKTLAAGNSNIIFTGRQHGKALQELYGNAYVFVQPSESEGFSIALLEAMSYGLPVIASDIKENQEVAGASGIFFKNKDVRMLARTLRYVLRYPKKARSAGREGRQLVRQNYDWDKLAGIVAHVYAATYRYKNNNISIYKSNTALLTADNKH